MKRFFLVFSLTLFCSIVYSYSLKTIDSILVSNGYYSNIDNLESDNYYEAWKKFEGKTIRIEVFGEDEVNQIRLSQIVCPTLDELSKNEESEQIEYVKTRVLQEIGVIMDDESVIKKLEELKVEQPWRNSKEYEDEWLVGQGIVVKYKFYKQAKCDKYLDGFRVIVSVRNL